MKIIYIWTNSQVLIFQKNVRKIDILFNNFFYIWTEMLYSCDQGRIFNNREIYTRSAGQNVEGLFYQHFNITFIPQYKNGADYCRITSKVYLMNPDWDMIE